MKLWTAPFPGDLANVVDKINGGLTFKFSKVLHFEVQECFIEVVFLITEKEYAKLTRRLKKEKIL